MAGIRTKCLSMAGCGSVFDGQNKDAKSIIEADAPYGGAFDYYFRLNHARSYE